MERCASEKQSLGGVVELIEDLGQLAMMVLHTMTLINDHVLPTNLVVNVRGKHNTHNTYTNMVTANVQPSTNILHSQLIEQDAIELTHNNISGLT